MMRNLPAHCYDEGAPLAPFIPDGDESRVCQVAAATNRFINSACIQHSACRAWMRWSPKPGISMPPTARRQWMPLKSSRFQIGRGIRRSRTENWFGTGQRIVMAFDEFDTLGDRATLLLLKLRRHHWGEQFQMTKMLASALGWRVQNFKAARDELIRAQIIECIHPGGRHPNDPPLSVSKTIQDDQERAMVRSLWGSRWLSISKRNPPPP